jgi:hypothetical protein
LCLLLFILAAAARPLPVYNIKYEVPTPRKTAASFTAKSDTVWSTLKNLIAEKMELPSVDLLVVYRLSHNTQDRDPRDLRNAINLLEMIDEFETARKVAQSRKRPAQFLSTCWIAFQSK